MGRKGGGVDSCHCSPRDNDSSSKSCAVQVRGRIGQEEEEMVGPRDF